MSEKRVKERDGRERRSSYDVRRPIECNGNERSGDEWEEKCQKCE